MSITPALTVEEKMRGWVARAYGEEEGRKVEAIPFDVLCELYPELAKFGPSCGRLFALHKAMGSMLTVADPPGKSRNAALKTRAHILKVISNMPVYDMDEMNIPDDHAHFIANTRSYIAGMLLLQPGMSLETGVGSTYSILLLSIVTDGIFKDERYMPEMLVENMAQVAVLENLLFSK